MNKFVLHVGLSKTATTTIQEAFFAIHSQVYYLGKHPEFPGTRGCRSEVIYRALEPAIWRLSAPLDADRSRCYLQEEVLPTLTNHKVLVGSWEGLASMASQVRFAEVIRRLSCIFGGCKVMITLRNPFTRLPSLYLQELRGHFIKRNNKHIGQRAFIEFDDWLKRVTTHGQGAGPLSYGKNIREAIALLGKEKVGVFLYEDLVADPEMYYGGICDFLGIELGECLHLTYKAHQNRRITKQQLEIVRSTDSSLLRRIAWRLGRERYRKRVLERGCRALPDDDPPARIVLPEPIRQQIREESREAHRWLMRELRLDLEKHGYPL